MKASAEATSGLSHGDLVKRGARWLRALGCSVVLEEQVAYVYNGETPDLIGWTSSRSVVVEVKVSRSDFFRDQKKPFRGNHLKGMGSYRFYLTPPGLLSPQECPAGWGIYEVKGRRVCHLAGASYRNAATAPFQPCLLSERAMLVSALRRHQESMKPVTKTTQLKG